MVFCSGLCRFLSACDCRTAPPAGPPQTSIADFGGSSFIVIRRFSDFDWLHEELARRHAGLIIPPVPDKAMVGTWRWDGDRTPSAVRPSAAARRRCQPRVVLVLRGQVGFRKSSFSSGGGV